MINIYFGLHSSSSPNWSGRLFDYPKFKQKLLCLPGLSHVIGSVLPIFAAPGNDVLLPCHLEPPLNVEELTIEWSRPDLLPSSSDLLSQLQYVHVHREHHEDQDMKSHLYMGRTSLFENELKHGNISLKIANVTVQDEGLYKCFVPKLRGGMKEAFVRLVVGGCSLCRVADRGLSPSPPKKVIHILMYFKLWNVHLCFVSEPTAVKTTVAWIYPTEFSTTGPVEEEVKGERNWVKESCGLFLQNAICCITKR